jgi:hemerythrin-like metal-binding protein
MALSFLESIGVTPEIEARIMQIWQEKNFALNIPIIDLQHLWLIFLLVEIESVIKNENNEEEFQKISMELVNFTIEHFTLEESLFIRFDYPQHIGHKKQHQTFVGLMKERFNLSSLKDQNIKQELVDFLWDWLTVHILKEDYLYKEFLEQSNTKHNEWFKFLIENGQVTIDKAQAELFNKITKSTQVKEIIGENLYRSINNIWHVYNLSLHLPVVDLQHLWLIKMTVELDYASKNLVSSKREEVFRSIIKGAVQYTKEHFYIEEKIMQKFHYSGFPNHLKQHQGFMEFIQLRNKQHKQGDIKAAANLVVDLKEWLLGHIAIEDRNMSMALKEYNSDIILYTRELLQEGDLKVRKSQLDLYNKIMGVKGF